MNDFDRIREAHRRESLTRCMQSFNTWPDSDKQDFQLVMTTGPDARGAGLKLCYECGLERGIAEGMHDMAVLLLETRFGWLSDEARRRLSLLSNEELRRLMRDFLQAQSLKDLRLED